MRKVWVIARREYRAAVRTKGFIVSMVLMPALMVGSVGIQVLFKNLDADKEKKFAVIDRTGGQLAAALQTAAGFYNEYRTVDPETKARTAPRVALEVIPPGSDSPEAVEGQRYELSQRVERDDLDGVIEIGKNVFAVRGDPYRSKDAVPDDAAIRFQAKRPTQRPFMAWAEQAINAAVQAGRFRDKNLDSAEIKAIQEEVPLKYTGLTVRTAAGKLEDAKEGAQIANFVLPGVLIGMMFMLIMVGATPAMHGVVEEKAQRIAEVLLGSVSPFEMMAGKLLGVVGVSLTTAAVYLGGGYAVAEYYGFAGVLTPGVIASFLLFLVLALLMFGSLFIAVGAAAADVKDSQNLLMPVMLIACLPFFALGPIMQDPSGPIAIVGSWFPTSAPFVLVARQAVPPGVPLGQLVGGVAVVLATTLFCVWAAGRIFRVGLLMQGQGPKFADLARWVMKG